MQCNDKRPHSLFAPGKNGLNLKKIPTKNEGWSIVRGLAKVNLNSIMDFVFSACVSEIESLSAVMHHISDTRLARNSRIITQQQGWLFVAYKFMKAMKEGRQGRRRHQDNFWGFQNGNGKVLSRNHALTLAPALYLNLYPSLYLVFPTIKPRALITLHSQLRRKIVSKIIIPWNTLIRNIGCLFPYSYIAQEGTYVDAFHKQKPDFSLEIFVPRFLPDHSAIENRSWTKASRVNGRDGLD